MAESEPRAFIPAIQRTSNLVVMALVAVIVFIIASVSKITVVSPTHDIKVEAATRMDSAMTVLKNLRMEKGVFVDLENDPNETGLVGTQFSLITTDEGDLDAKLTTLDPNFAAVMVELLWRANVRTGDTMAVAFTGSMPGANMAMLFACDVMNITPISITSVGASQWGANLPGFTWLDIEEILFQEGLVSHKSVAASIGGRNDMGRLLSPRGRSIINETIADHNLPLIYNDRLALNIQERMSLYERYLPLGKYSAFVNVGGGVASLGTKFNHRLLSPGVVYRSDIEVITHPDGIEGVISKFAKFNLPIIHILNIQTLTENLKIPYAPIPLPEIGSGELYAEVRYNPWITGICLLIIVVIVYVIGYRSHKQIKARMEEHEPDSIL